MLYYLTYIRFRDISLPCQRFRYGATAVRDVAMNGFRERKTWNPRCARTVKVLIGIDHALRQRWRRRRPQRRSARRCEARARPSLWSFRVQRFTRLIYRESRIDRSVSWEMLRGMPDKIP